MAAADPNLSAAATSSQQEFDSAHGTFLIGSPLTRYTPKDVMALSSESRVSVRESKESVEFTIKKTEDGKHEYRLNKSVVRDDYVAVVAGPVTMATNVLRSMEAEAAKDRKAGSKVDLDYLTKTLRKAMDALYVEKKDDASELVRVQSIRYILVALDSEKQLRMRGFGFSYGSAVSGYRDIVDTFWFAGGDENSKAAAKEVLNKNSDRMESVWKLASRSPVDMFMLHHRAMIAASRKDPGIGGYHKMISIWVNEDGKLATEQYELAIGK